MNTIDTCLPRRTVGGKIPFKICTRVELFRVKQKEQQMCQYPPVWHTQITCNMRVRAIFFQHKWYFLYRCDVANVKRFRISKFYLVQIANNKYIRTDKYAEHNGGWLKDLSQNLLKATTGGGTCYFICNNWLIDVARLWRTIVNRTLYITRN